MIRRVLGALLLLALIAGACEGDDSSTDTSDTGVPVAQNDDSNGNADDGSVERIRNEDRLDGDMVVCLSEEFGEDLNFDYFDDLDPSILSGPVCGTTFKEVLEFLEASLEEGQKLKSDFERISAELDLEAGE